MGFLSRDAILSCPYCGVCCGCTAVDDVSDHALLPKTQALLPKTRASLLNLEHGSLKLEHGSLKLDHGSLKLEHVSPIAAPAPKCFLANFHNFPLISNENR